tara:strand:- start:7542 stop:8168 length:627 start_codon:yes stop_codon:yes gene_type:complete
MNYTDLKTNIQAAAEDEFSTANLNLFIQQAEDRIYNTVQIPALRSTTTDTLTISTKLFTLPADFVWMYSITVVDGTTHSYLLSKDVNFLREAYPDATVEGLPKHYAMYDENTLIVAPTPDSGYTVQLHYGRYPESIVTAATTWLGDNCEAVLFSACMVEAIRFQKGEGDMVQMYDKMYLGALAGLDNLGNAKLRNDAYRAGQPIKQVR